MFDNFGRAGNSEGRSRWGLRTSLGDRQRRPALQWLPREVELTLRYLLTGALLASAAVSPALAQDNTAITVVLSEELDLVEPCMATRSNIGRVILQNINETLTELDVRGDAGLMPRLAESW